MQPVPNHPFAWYRVNHSSPQDMWLDFQCTHCGDQTRYRCSRPQLQNHRILQYARMHAHGLTPRRRG